jgi:hypothetical protein
LLFAQDVHIGFRVFYSNAIKLLLCRIREGAEEKPVEIPVVEGDGIAGGWRHYCVEMVGYCEENGIEV